MEHYNKSLSQLAVARPFDLLVTDFTEVYSWAVPSDPHLLSLDLGCFLIIRLS